MTCGGGRECGRFRALGFKQHQATASAVTFVADPACLLRQPWQHLTWRGLVDWGQRRRVWVACARGRKQRSTHPVQPCAPCSSHPPRSSGCSAPSPGRAPTWGHERGMTQGAARGLLRVAALHSMAQASQSPGRNAGGAAHAKLPPPHPQAPSAPTRWLYLVERVVVADRVRPLGRLHIKRLWQLRQDGLHGLPHAACIGAARAAPRLPCACGYVGVGMWVWACGAGARGA